VAEGTELRLVETEDRLARLESLLKGVAAQAPYQDEPVCEEDPIADEETIPEEETIAEEEPFLDDHEFERPNGERQEFERPQFGHQRFERHQAERHLDHHEQVFMDELSA
jgi:hypothetical protein